MRMKSFNELMTLDTFEERFAYLQSKNQIGNDTFGHNRYLNQALYSSNEWKRTRRAVLLRDNGCDLGVVDRPIMDRAVIHHINPLTIEDIITRDPKVFDLNNLITVSDATHRAIHYGSSESLSSIDFDNRFKNDTKLW